MKKLLKTRIKVTCRMQIERYRDVSVAVPWAWKPDLRPRECRCRRQPCSDLVAGHEWHGAIPKPIYAGGGRVDSPGWLAGAR